MIGMKKEPIIQNFLTQMPVRFVVDTSLPVVMTGVCIEVDTQTGRATSIERIRVVDDAVQIDGCE
jgi:calcineurin-like phosphoesterase